MNRIEYILVEKSFVIRKGIKALLEDYGNYRPVAELANCSNLSKLVIDHNPAIVFLNTEESAPNFITDFIHSIPAAKRPILVALTKESTDEKPNEAIKFQLNTLANQDESEAVIKQITALFQEVADDEKTELTTREQDILRTVALGLTNKEIAEKLFISQHTVITHRKNITRKLGIKSVSGLTVYAILNNLISADEIE